MERTIIPTQRQVNARLVPTGDPISIAAGSFVTLTQALGGTYTVIHNGNMARIDGQDADALGFEPQVLDFKPSADGKVNLDQVNEAIASVYDPEIPVSVVALGLIYCVAIDDQGKVTIEMTLTAPGCGMGPVLVQDITSRVNQVPFVSAVQVDLVFEPPWSREMMSEEAQLELGLF